MRQLDRYVLGAWIKLFVITTLGFPLVTILINLTDSLNKLLDRGLSWQQILLSYAYGIPENIFLIMPAAVLFATVFTVGAMGRHSELTAAKASGQSFHRMLLPIFIAATVAVGLDVAAGELAVGASARQNEIQQKRPPRSSAGRYNFVYRADQGWVYTIRSLDVADRRLDDVLFERAGEGIDYPALVVTADSAVYDTTRGHWRLWNGASRVIANPEQQVAFQFHTLKLRAFNQSPAELLAEPKAPDEMRYAELGRYIDALKRSGNDASKLEVEQALKLALPVTCLIIALFGAPLAATSHRSGAAAGVAISLGTTVGFLLLAQIARAVGAGGAIHPVAAAWLPNAAFLAAALVLLARVRT